jgi:fructokinase
MTTPHTAHRHDRTRIDEPGGALRIGVDLGGTKIEGVALDRAGRELLRRRVPTPRNDYDATLGAVAELVFGIESELGCRGSVGVGMPGTLSPATGLVKNANSVWLNGRALDADLSARLGRRLRFANDANCFTLSEATDGAGRGAGCVFGVIIGTGTGGGLVVHGRVWTGPNAIAGEWGHNALPWPEDAERPGPRCYCGRFGCIETFLSGPGLTDDHALSAGKHMMPIEIAAGAQSGDAGCRATLERYERRMARALASIVNVLDPEVIVLGGGLSNLPGLYRNVPRLWERWVFSDRVDTRLVPPRHGDSSGVRGAARLWGPDEAGLTARSSEG